MGFSHGDCHNQLVRFRASDYKLRDIVGGDGCALCTELKLLELLREELTRKTSELRVKINLSHSAINRQLPPEILATIFEAYVDDPSYEDFLYEQDVADLSTGPRQSASFGRGVPDVARHCVVDTPPMDIAHRSRRLCPTTNPDTAN